MRERMISTYAKAGSLKVRARHIWDSDIMTGAKQAGRGERSPAFAASILQALVETCPFLRSDFPYCSRCG
jgi:hypothetical protein